MSILSLSPSSSSSSSNSNVINIATNPTPTLTLPSDHFLMVPSNVLANRLASIGYVKPNRRVMESEVMVDEGGDLQTFYEKNPEFIRFAVSILFLLPRYVPELLVNHSPSGAKIEHDKKGLKQFRIALKCMTEVPFPVANGSIKPGEQYLEICFKRFINERPIRHELAKERLPHFILYFICLLKKGFNLFDFPIEKNIKDCFQKILFIIWIEIAVRCGRSGRKVNIYDEDIQSTINLSSFFSVYESVLFNLREVVVCYFDYGYSAIPSTSRIRPPPGHPVICESSSDGSSNVVVANATVSSSSSSPQFFSSSSTFSPLVTPQIVTNDVDMDMIEQQNDNKLTTDEQSIVLHSNSTPFFFSNLNTNDAKNDLPPIESSVTETQVNAVTNDDDDDDDDGESSDFSIHIDIPTYPNPIGFFNASSFHTESPATTPTSTIFSFNSKDSFYDVRNVQQRRDSVSSSVVRKL